MKRYVSYLWYVLRHKFYVFQACRELCVPMHIAILHDWDKFLPDEFLPYARTFYKPDGSKQYVESQEFTAAWNAHQKRNKHHWQYWLITWDRGTTEALSMPDVYRREMVADWRGAGRALGKPDTKAWYVDNYDKIKLHPETREWIDQRLGLSIPRFAVGVAVVASTDNTAVKGHVVARRRDKTVLWEYQIRPESQPDKLWWFFDGELDYDPQGQPDLKLQEGLTA